MTNEFVRKMKNPRRYIYIYNLFNIILISLLFITPSLADDDSKKCVVYRDGKLMYNPDNPKIHCTTLQLLDDFWSDRDVNVPNPDKKPEDFAEILTLEDIISNGKTTCNNTPTIQNGTFPSKTVSEGTKIKGQCNEGYSGSITAICDANNNWKISGSCEGKLCENPITQQNANAFKATTLRYGDKAITASCKSGYMGLDGANQKVTATCDINGVWQYKGECSRTMCSGEKLKTQPNANPFPNITLEYSQAHTATCINDKTKTTKATCGGTGKWSYAYGICTYCPKLSAVANGSIQYDDTYQNLDSKATLKCNNGYEVSGNATATCQSDRTWTALGTCISPVTCNNPTTQTNAEPFTTTTLKYGENAITASCKTGYIGSITATCNTDGSWKYAGICETEAAISCGSGTLTGDSTNGYCTYNYTGSIQTFTASSVDKIYLKVWGGQGGKGSTNGGKGGYSHGSLSLNSGNNNLYVYVGGQGQTATTKGALGTGGWNGGGNCYMALYQNCGGGGGATDIRKGGTSDSNRIIVAGGGGGTGEQIGTAGGGKNSNGVSCGANSYYTGSTGGTSSEPGHGSEVRSTHGCSNPQPGNDGVGSRGGDTAQSGRCYSAGAGGGGYFGGGSGAITWVGGGGAGGSGYVGGVENGNGSNGIKEGNGLARICWGSYANSSNCPNL